MQKDTVLPSVFDLRNGKFQGWGREWTTPIYSLIFRPRWCYYLSRFFLYGQLDWLAYKGSQLQMRNFLLCMCGYNTSNKSYTELMWNLMSQALGYIMIQITHYIFEGYCLTDRSTCLMTFTFTPIGCTFVRVFSEASRVYIQINCSFLCYKSYLVFPLVISMLSDCQLLSSSSPPRTHHSLCWLDHKVNLCLSCLTLRAKIQSMVLHVFL